MPPEEIVERPIYSVMSGPTLAPIAGMHLTDAPTTSSSSTWAAPPSTSRPCATAISWSRRRRPSAWRCSAFPRSTCARSAPAAAASPGSMRAACCGSARRAPARVPGPACYGRGGTEATVTDANVVLGIIDPDYFLGGKIKLDRAKAEAAVGKIAEQLKLGLVEAAYAIYTTSNHNMIAAIEDITDQRGHRSARQLCGQRRRRHRLPYRRHGAACSASRASWCRASPPASAPMAA